MASDPHRAAPRPVAPDDEFRAIVAGDFCSGCGACAVATAGRTPLRFRPEGRYLPDLAEAGPADLALAARVCPFSSHGPDEDEIAGARFPDLPRHPEIGRHAASFVGHVAEPGFRTRGSSGGLTSWIAARLLAQDDIAGVLHVRPSPGPEGPLFHYAVARRADELAAGAKSHYYPIEMSGVLAQLQVEEGRRYAVIGLPCFLKALHRLAVVDSRIAAALGPTIGLVCGHLKTAAFAEALAFQAGIPPHALAAIDFRHKLPDRPASDYAMAASATDGHVVVRPMAELAGRDWGQGWFRLNACSYCDDVVAETADVSVGDAWLPGWVDDSGGTNVAVARSHRMRALIEGGIADGSLALQPLSADDVARSQAGGLRYRRDALELRLADAQDAGRWVPRKRVKPARRIPRQRRKLLALREEMARFSREAGREARATGDFQPLFQHMRELAAQERQAAGPGPFQRLKRRLKRMLKPG